MNSKKSAVKNPYLIVMAIVGIMFLCLLVGYFTFNGGNNAKMTENTSTTDQTKNSNNQSKPVIPEQVQSFENPEAAGAAIKRLTRHDANDPLAKGRLNAPVTMIQFYDYSCPMCMKFEMETAPKLDKYLKDGTLRIEFHHYPIFADKYHSDLAAKGAIAAGKQGKFWEYLKATLDLGATEGHVNWSEAKVEQAAKTAGINNIDQFKQDMNAPETKADMDKDTLAAQEFGIAGTPAFFLNNRIVPGALPYNIFAQAIEAMKAGAK